MQKTFQQYLNDCSFLFQKVKAVNFQNQFYDRVVKWKGRVKAIGTNEIEIILDPAKTLEDEPDMTLKLLAKRIQKSADKIIPGGDLFFRAQLLTFKGLSGPTIVCNLAKKDLPKSEDLTITYKEFDQKFGLTPECNAHVCFEQKWQGEQVKFTGTITSIDPTSTESDCCATAHLESSCKPEIRIEGDWSAVAAATPEPIIMNIPTEFSDRIPELQSKIASKTPLVLSVYITGRTTSHELRLDQILNEAPSLVTVPSSFHSAPTSSSGRKPSQLAVAAAIRSYSRGSESGDSPGRSVSPSPYGSTSRSPWRKSPSAKRSASALRLQAMMEEQKRKEEQDNADKLRREAMVERIRRSTSPNPYLEESVTPPPPP